MNMKLLPILSTIYHNYTVLKLSMFDLQSSARQLQ